MDQVIWSLIHLIRRKYLTLGSVLKPMDFAQITQFFTLDVITCLSLGQPFGWITEDKDIYEYVKTVENNLPVINFFSAVPLLSAIMRIPAVQKAAIPGVKDRVGMGKVNAYDFLIFSRTATSGTRIADLTSVLQESSLLAGSKRIKIHGKI
jgi:hypothetical protein